MPLVRLDQLQQFAAINVLSDPGAIGGPIVIPNCVQIVLQFGMADGKTAHVVTYGRAAGIPAPSTTQAQAIFAALTTGAAWTAFNALQTNGGGLAAVTLRSVHAAGAALVSSTGAAAGGAATGAPLPCEVALVVTKRTGFVGPGFRGRMYFTNWTVESLAAGNIASAAAVTALQNWVNGFAAIFSGQGYTHVLGLPARASYTGSTGTVHPARPAQSVDIASLTVRDNHWDTQRRRGLR